MRGIWALLIAAILGTAIIMWGEMDQDHSIAQIDIPPRPAAPPPSTSTAPPPIVNPIGDCTPR